jgi:hypothetical protein
MVMEFAAVKKSKSTQHLKWAQQCWGSGLDPK